MRCQLTRFYSHSNTPSCCATRVRFDLTLLLLSVGKDFERGDLTLLLLSVGKDFERGGSDEQGISQVNRVSGRQGDGIAYTDKITGRDSRQVLRRVLG